MQSVLVTCFYTRCNSSRIVMKGLRSKLVSCVVVLLSQFVLAMVPHIFPSLSLLAMLPIAALVMVTTYAFAGWFRRLLGIAASAPAMVICHILFLFGVHITVVRKGIPSLLDASLNIECILLLIGLYRIFSSDPGLVSIESTCTGVLGQTDPSEVDLQDKRTLSGHLVISTLLFSSLQVLWQMPFLTWHIYCICCNIKTEEWVNWRKYREFQRTAQPQQGQLLKLSRQVVKSKAM